MESPGKAFHGEEVAANVAQAKVVPPKHIADSLRSSIVLLCDFFDRGSHQFLAHLVEFGVGPQPVVCSPLDAVLDHKPPTRLASPSRVALDSRSGVL